MLAQFIIGLFVLRTQAGYDIFAFISGLAVDLLGFANQGVDFLTHPGFAEATPWFLITVIPAIIFFVSFVQLLFYWGLLQWIIIKMASFFFWIMGVSGAEAVVASASPFIGQGESAMLIKPFVPHLTLAELHQVMCSGFATIAGSVLIAYIAFGVNPQVLVSSCVMSIPASLAISKMRYPEEEETLTAGRVVIPDDDEHRATNSLHAFAQGAWLGLKIGGMIGATLLCILALLGLANGLLTWWGHYLNIPELSKPTSPYIFSSISMKRLHTNPILSSHRAHSRLHLLPDRLPPRRRPYWQQRSPRRPAHRHQDRRERVRRVLPPRRCPAAVRRRPLRPKQDHRLVRALRVREHRVAGQSDRCSEPDRPGKVRRRVEDCGVCAVRGHFVDVDECEHCGDVDH